MSPPINSIARSMAAAQVDRYLMEHAPRERPRGSPGTRPTITISRAFGIPAREIADRLAEALALHVFDREVLEVLQQDTRLGDQIIRALDEGKRSTLDSWIEGYLEYKRPIVDDISFHRMLSRVIRSISLHGSAVIIGRGANFVLRKTDALRVRLIAPLKLRIEAIGKGVEGRAPVPSHLAEEEIRKYTERRRHFIRKHFQADIDDPSAYDVVFNLKRLDPDYAAGLILDTFRRTVTTAS